MGRYHTLFYSSLEPLYVDLKKASWEKIQALLREYNSTKVALQSENRVINKGLTRVLVR